MSNYPNTLDEAFNGSLGEGDGSFSNIRSSIVYLGDDENEIYSLRVHHLESDHDLGRPMEVTLTYDPISLSASRQRRYKDGFG